jgi:hypothetical protein
MEAVASQSACHSRDFGPISGGVHLGRGSKRRLAIIGLVAMTGCASSETASQPRSEYTIGSQLPTSSGGSPPTDTSPAGESDAEVLFEDDFSDPTSGWPRAPTPEMVAIGLDVAYAEEGYRIAAAKGAKVSYALPLPGGQSAESVRLNADIQKRGEPAIYGLLCRGDKDLNDFYVFTIDTNGHFAIGKVVAGKASVLRIGAEPVPAIRPSGEVNEISAECLSRPPNVLLRLIVNGEELMEVDDGDALAGPNHVTAGIYLETTQAGDVELSIGRVGLMTLFSD